MVLFENQDGKLRPWAQREVSGYAGFTDYGHDTARGFGWARNDLREKLHTEYEFRKAHRKLKDPEDDLKISIIKPPKPLESFYTEPEIPKPLTTLPKPVEPKSETVHTPLKIPTIDYDAIFKLQQRQQKDPEPTYYTPQIPMIDYKAMAEIQQKIETEQRQQMIDMINRSNKQETDFLSTAWELQQKIQQAELKRQAAQAYSVQERFKEDERDYFAKAQTTIMDSFLTINTKEDEKPWFFKHKYTGIDRTVATKKAEQELSPLETGLEESCSSNETNTASKKYKLTLPDTFKCPPPKEKYDPVNEMMMKTPAIWGIVAVLTAALLLGTIYAPQIVKYFKNTVQKHEQRTKNP